MLDRSATLEWRCTSRRTKQLHMSALAIVGENQSVLPQRRRLFKSTRRAFLCSTFRALSKKQLNLLVPYTFDLSGSILYVLFKITKTTGKENHKKWPKYTAARI